MTKTDSEHASASWQMAYQNDAIGFLARGHWPPALESLLRTLRFSEPEVWLGESLSAPSLDRALERWRQVFQKLPLREAGIYWREQKGRFLVKYQAGATARRLWLLSLRKVT